MMHAAPLTSPRLQRLLKLLADGRPHSTRDIVRRARVMVPGTCVSELRSHGAEISCVKQAGRHGAGWRWYYTMTKGPTAK